MSLEFGAANILRYCIGTHDTVENGEEEGDFEGFICSCRALTTFLKESVLQTHLNRSLKVKDTRWNE